MKFPIKYQILLIAMIPVLLIDAVFTYLHINNSIQQAEKLLRSKGQVIAQQLASATEFNLLSGNYAQIDHLLEASIGKNNILNLALYDADGKIVAQASAEDFNPDDTTDYAYSRHAVVTPNLELQDIFQPDETQNANAWRTLGWVHMYLSTQQLQQVRKQIFLEGAVFFFSMLLIATVLTLVISRRLTRPIYTMLDHLKRVETGRLGETIDELENNEIGDVQKGFNNMSQALLANHTQLDQRIKSATLELMNAVTSLEYNNRELATARDKAQQADQVKSQFLANMSHEIRTPINGIQGFINLLCKSGLKADQKRYADIIARSTTDLTSIVNEILDFSKLESDKVELTCQPFDLCELLENARDNLFASTLEKGIDLNLCIYSDTPRWLIGDPLRIKQILLNLIGNAIKFTDMGHVSITALMEDDHDSSIMLRVEIEDSGIGISDADQKDLFQAFKQIESDTKRRYSGTGLGLAISKNLARLMGGDIRLESQLGKGSRFTLLLPLKIDTEQPRQTDPEDLRAMIYATRKRGLSEIQSLYNRCGYTTETEHINESRDIDQLHRQLKMNLPHLDLIVLDLRHEHRDMHRLISPDITATCTVIIMHHDLQQVDLSLYPDCHFVSTLQHTDLLIDTLQGTGAESSQQATSQAQSGTATKAGKKLLIVDDNPVNLALACELTTLWGHHPQQAADANAAMKLFRQQTFDLILLDIQMPVIDGVQLMQMMREFQPGLQAPIVAITANALEQEKQRLLKLGFNAFISKPINEDKLQQVLNRKAALNDEAAVEGIASEGIDSEETAVSVDYELTRKLSANNVKLIKATFSLLQLELPGFVEELSQAIEAEDGRLIGDIMHKLRGVCCYAGLPELKRLLDRYDDAKTIDRRAILAVCREVRAELQRIEDTLQQRGDADL